LTMPVKGKDKFIPLKVDYEIRHVQKEVVWDKIIIADSMWCFPKEGSFKMKMRSMMDNHGAIQKKATQLADWLKENWPDEEETFKAYIKETLNKERFSGNYVLNDEDILEYA